MLRSENLIDAFQREAKKLFATTISNIYIYIYISRIKDFLKCTSSILPLTKFEFLFPAFEASESGKVISSTRFLVNACCGTYFLH